MENTNKSAFDSEQPLSENSGKKKGADNEEETVQSNLINLPSTGIQPSDTRPNIMLSDRQLRDILEDCEKVMLKSTNPPLFRMGDFLISITKENERSEKVRKFSPNKLLKHLIDRANFWKNSSGKIASHDHAHPPKKIADILLENLNPLIPEIEMISSHPLLTRDDVLHLNPGYNPTAKACIRQQGGYMDVLPPLDEALDILRDVFVDFPFEGKSDYANLIAALLQQIIRLSIDTTTPLFGIEASTAGSGKTMLATIVSLIVFGTDPKTISLPNNDDEARRLITSVLLEGSECVHLDNCYKIDSKSVAAVLTSRYWQDRILGTNRTSDVPNNALWMSTGNNPVLSIEIARRYIPIRLRPRQEKPWERDNFRHPNLKRHVKENRQKILGALLTLVDNWLKNGKPKGSYPLGAYEGWSETIGGILDSAGIPDFLENRTKMLERNNEESTKMRALFEHWFNEHGPKELSVKMILEFCNKKGLLWEEIRGGSERSQATRLGKKLKAATGQCFGSFLLSSKPDSHTGSNRYYLEKIAE